MQPTHGKFVQHLDNNDNSLELKMNEKHDLSQQLVLQPPVQDIEKQISPTSRVKTPLCLRRNNLQLSDLDLNIPIIPTGEFR